MGELLALLFKGFRAPIDETREWFLSSMHPFVVVHRMSRLAPPTAHLAYVFSHSLSLPLGEFCLRFKLGGRKRTHFVGQAC